MMHQDNATLSLEPVVYADGGLIHVCCVTKAQIFRPKNVFNILFKRIFLTWKTPTFMNTFCSVAVGLGAVQYCKLKVDPLEAH